MKLDENNLWLEYSCDVQTTINYTSEKAILIRLIYFVNHGTRTHSAKLFKNCLINDNTAFKNHSRKIQLLKSDLKAIVLFRFFFLFQKIGFDTEKFG